MSCNKSVTLSYGFSPSLTGVIPAGSCSGTKGIPSNSSAAPFLGVRASKPLSSCDCFCEEKPCEKKAESDCQDDNGRSGIPLCSTCLVDWYNLTPTQIGDLRPNC